MRTGLLFLIALLLIAAGIYYQNDGQLPSLTSSTATSSEAVTSTEKVGFMERFLSWLPGKKDESVMTDDEIPETEVTEKETDKTDKAPINIFIPSAPDLSITEIKQQATDIANQLSDVSVDIEALAEQESASPYTDQVTLKVGNAKTTEPDAEYLVLSAPSSNQAAINITGWKLESTVSHKSDVLPEGNRYLASEVDRDKGPIMLYPGEQAYIITGDNPLRVSFRENICTGYLSEEGDFSPNLGKYCPLPSDELLVYGGDHSDNSNCNDFVSSLSRCSEADSEDMEEAHLPGGCEIFIESVLTYKGCVNKHSGEVGYLDEGVWRIYFDRNGELWRSTNETIKLLDSAGRLITKLTY